MKKNLFLTALITAALLASNICFAQTPKQALSVQITGIDDKAIEKDFGKKLLSAITKLSDKYEAVDRENVDTLEIGKLRSADIVLVIAVNDMGSFCYISAKMVNVQTAEIEATTSIHQKLQSEKDFNTLADEIAKNLIGKQPDAYHKEE